MRVLHRGHDHDRCFVERRADRRGLPRALKGNLCRCTGYRAIEDAIQGNKTIDDDVKSVPLQRRRGGGVPTLASLDVVTGQAG